MELGYEININEVKLRVKHHLAELFNCIFTEEINEPVLSVPRTNA